MNAIDSLLDHVLSINYDALPPEAVEASKIFVLDSIGVGISGSRHPLIDQVKRAAAEWGEGRQARVWNTGEWMPAGSAVLLNAYQVHNQEFDCLHDQAVVHAPATILPVLLAQAERMGGCSGKDLIAAFVAGVDVASFIGMSQGAPMRFFRPAMCGALGAAAAIATLVKADREQMRNVLGITYSHLSGTMQAHIEGSPTLALQVGLNARAVFAAFDLAAQGIAGPKDILEGPYGYFALFDGQADWKNGSVELGRVFQATRLSHKPFPSGRATHGGIDGVQRLQARHGFAAADVASIRVATTPLIRDLVGRPIRPDMEVGYAKLCMGYVVATALLTGTVGITDFEADKRADPERLELGARVQVVPNDVTDPNALVPQSVEVSLRDGRVFSIELAAVLGHPDRPLERDARLQKFEACCASARVPLDTAQVMELIAALEQLDQLEDARRLVDLAIA